MKKIIAALCAAALLFCATGCASGAKKTELIVFAAASLQESLTRLGERYTAENRDVTVLINFDSSGTLKTQIEAGADCDIFISAGQMQMDQLEDLVENRTDLLENKVVLAVPPGNPAKIASYEDLKAALLSGQALLAMGNADVPVGQYTRKILEYFGLSEEELAEAGCLTFGSNAREVTTQVAEGMVDCGILYATDALSAGLTVVDTATAEMCGQVIYPAAVVSSSGQKAAAEAFLDFLQSDAADEVFGAVGFTPVS